MCYLAMGYFTNIEAWKENSGYAILSIKYPHFRTTSVQYITM